MKLSRLTTELRLYDWWLVILSAVLVSISLASIYSIDLSRGENLIFLPRQIVSIVIGAALFFFASRVHVSWYRTHSLWWYLAGLFLLLGVLLFGETIRGTTGWFRFFGLSFQPVEFAKAALVLSLALLVERQDRRFNSLQFLAKSGLLVFIYVFLILLQPDLGSASVLLCLWLGILFLTRTKQTHLAFLIGLGVLFSILAWFFFLAPYQKNRVTTFINPTSDPLGSGYNVNQSLIAIGAGGLLGRGLGFGSQSQLHFIPEAQSDFIFSVIAEELGLIGALIVVLLYSILLWRCLRIAYRANNDFLAFTVLGIMMLILVQVVFNIGATLGLLPVTGLPLPFLSYGGSSVIVNLLLLGVAESIARSANLTKHNANMVEGIRC